MITRYYLHYLCHYLFSSAIIFILIVNAQDTGLLSQELVASNTPLNISILSLLLVLGLTTNLLAFPVMLFRRTRWPPSSSPAPSTG